jgi:multidrug resistance efflux pump
MRSFVCMFVVLTTPVLVGCHQQGAEPQAAEPQDGSIQIPGTFVAKRQFHVNAKVGGQVREIFVQEGDEVQPGQELAAMDATELELAFKRSKAMLERAQAIVARDETELRSAECRIVAAEAIVRQTVVSRDIMRSKAQRYREMADKHAIEDCQVVEAENEVKVFEAQIEERQAAVKALKELPQREQLQISKTERALAEADLASARYRLDCAIVRAPSKGIVLTRRVARGDVIGDNAPGYRQTREMFVIADLSNVAVIADVPDRTLGRIHTGQHCDVFCDLPNPTVVTGQVIRMAPELTGQTRSAAIQVRLDPLSKEIEIRPGMAARVCIAPKE